MKKNSITRAGRDRFFWFTSYSIPTADKVSSEYGSYVIAPNELIAKAILKLRGLEENIESIALKINQRNRLGSVVKLYKKRKLLQCIHTLCFIGNIALNAKIIKHSDLLLDTGLIHDIMHEIEFPEKFQFRSSIYKRLKEFDKLSEFLGF